MKTCLICNKFLKNNRALGIHIRKSHGISPNSYKEKFGISNIIICKVEECTNPLTKNNKSGFCQKHRDRTGKNNNFYGKHHKPETKEIIRKKCQSATINLWKEEEYRKKVIKGLSKPRPDKFKKEQSVRMMKWYEDNPEQRDIRSKSMKASWVSGKIVKSNGKNSSNRSKQEVAFFKDIQEIVPHAKQGQTVRNEKNTYFFPDILFKEGIIIEYFGDHWHANPKTHKPEDIVHSNNTAKSIWDKDSQRIKDLESIGYKVIVVWQSDYTKNKMVILKSLDNLLNWESCAL